MEVREFGELYRRAAADLAIARAETRDPKLVNYLNSLVIRAHGKIYRAEGETFEDFPPHQSLFHRAEPVYEELEGWDEEIGRAAAFGDLPAAARKYLDRVEELVGVPIGVVSVGPGREQSLTPA